MNNTNPFERVPPQSVEAETAVIGSILLDNKRFELVLDVLFPEMFYKTAHKKIYDSCVYLRTVKKEPVDLITVSEILKQRKVLDEVGGAYYLTELAERVPSSARIEYYSRIIIEKYTLRKIISEANNIVNRCYNDSEPIDDIMEDISKMTLIGITRAESDRTMTDVIRSVMDRYEFVSKSGESITGVDTTIDAINAMTCGLQPKELIILAGRPSHGKTSWALQIGRELALKKKQVVGVFSLEMSEEQLGQRLISQQSRVSGFDIRHARVNQQGFEKMSRAIGELSEAMIIIDDTSNIDASYIRRRARAWKKKHKNNLGLIIIDYLGLIKLPNKVKKDTELGDVTQSLKGLCKELDCPILLLHQVNRDCERESRPPQISDLRDSGALEQDADVVMFTWRPHFKKNDATDREKRKATIIIGKARNGPIGSRDVIYEEKYTLFENKAFADQEFEV